MSAKRNFRVSVNLSEFFNDHRSRVRIWIDDDIKKIGDLERRIEEVYHIKNFQLASNLNHYLPPSEDVEILDDKELIWVFKNGDRYDKSVSKKTHKKRPLSQLVKSLEAKNKKKRTCARDTTEQEDTELSSTLSAQSRQDEIASKYYHTEYYEEKWPYVKKDKDMERLYRKLVKTMGSCLKYIHVISRGIIPLPLYDIMKSQLSEEILSEFVDVDPTKTTLGPEVQAGESVGEKVTAELETIERTGEDVNVATEVSEVASRDMETSEATDEAVDVPRGLPTEHNTSLTSDAEMGSFHLLSRNESTEFEGDDASDLNNQSDETIKPSDNSMLDFNRDDESFSSKMSTISTHARASGIGLLVGDLRSNSSLGSVDNLCSDYSEAAKKRRRKRARRRKKKNESGSTDASTSSVAVANSFTPTKSNTIYGCPKLHLVWVEGEDGVSVPVKKVRSRRNSLAESEPCSEKSSVGSTIMHNGKPHQISEEDILKAPLMERAVPKLRDVIAFRVLILTENFTPELSSHIIGKVIQYNEKSDEVLFTILSGFDQCEEAELEIWSGSEKIKTKLWRRLMKWENVLEPRLLSL